MSRLALVTGGSRGIGAAISKALKAAGYAVAATYSSNDERATAFSHETNIKTYSWNVSNYDECALGISKVEAELGPIDILVNNAGIIRDAPFHKMTRDQWNEVIRTNSDNKHFYYPNEDKSQDAVIFELLSTLSDFMGP